MNKHIKIVIACVFFLAAAALILFQLGVFDGPARGALPPQEEVDLEPAQDGTAVRDGVLETGQGVRRYGSEPSLIPD